MAGAWEETKHPRAQNGEFGQGSGGAAPSGASPRPAGPKSRTAAAGRISSVAKARRTVSGGAPPAQPKSTALPHADLAKLTGPAREAALADIATHAPRPDGELAHAFGNGAIRDPNWGDRVVALTPEAQKAVRGHFDSVVQKFGITGRPGANSHVLTTDDINNMGGAAGFRDHDGKIQLARQGLSSLHYHSGDVQDAKVAADRAQDATKHKIIESGWQNYEIMTHETLHDHGPELTAWKSSDGSDNIRHRTLAEEMSTEMAAQNIASLVHGNDPYDLKHTLGYADYIGPAIEHVATVAGVPHRDAYNAVIHAAMTLKRRNGKADATDALRDMAEDSLRKLQKFSPENHAALFSHWDALSNGILDKVKEMVASAKR